MAKFIKLHLELSGLARCVFVNADHIISVEDAYGDDAYGRACQVRVAGFPGGPIFAQGSAADLIAELTRGGR